MKRDHTATLTFSAVNLIELLRRLAREQTCDIAYKYLVNGEDDAIDLSYGELDRQARAIAAELTQAGLVGERALLLYPSGLEFIAGFFGCLYAGVVAVPAFPPRMNRMMARIQTIAADAQAAAALTTEAVFRRIQPMLAETPQLGQLRWFATEQTAPGLTDRWQPPEVSSDSLAVLQYTSGSTGTPKGVMLSHGNLISNIAQIAHAFEDPRTGCGVCWLPNYHDMGLVGGILQPLNQGKPQVLMSPMAFLQRPIRWLRAISRYGGTVSGGPNFAYDLCVNKIPPEKREGLDLSSWAIAFNGAEPVRAETIDRFVEAYAPHGFRREAFYPCYGLAEATLIVTGGYQDVAPEILPVDARSLERGHVVEAPENAAFQRRLVSSGRVLPEVEVRIVDPQTRSLCQEGQIGEIWIEGPSVAQGYWGYLDDAQQPFGQYVADTGEGPFLRTGDLGFFRDDELYVTGRHKDLIIIDGRNHFPQDIERSVEECHPAIQQGSCAAFSIDADDREQLVVAAEIERRYRGAISSNGNGHGNGNRRQRGGLDVDEVVQAIRRAVSRHHDLRVHEILLLKPGSIPKTSSGKIQRYACRDGFLAGTLSAWNQEHHGAASAQPK